MAHISYGAFFHMAHISYMTLFSVWRIFPIKLPIRVSVSVVVAQEIVFPHFFVPSNLQGLVHGGQEVLAQIGHQVDQVRKIFLDLLWRQSTHEVQSAVQLLLRLK